MFPILRSLLFIWEVLVIFTPLLRKGRRLRLPLLFREGALLVLSNWDLIWKYIEKRRWSMETVKKLLRLIRMRK